MQHLEQLVASHPDVWRQLDRPASRLALLEWLRREGRTVHGSPAAQLACDVATTTSNRGFSLTDRLRVGRPPPPGGPASRRLGL
jgi:hypothetical protein